MIERAEDKTVSRSVRSSRENTCSHHQHVFASRRILNAQSQTTSHSLSMINSVSWPLGAATVHKPHLATRATSLACRPVIAVLRSIASRAAVVCRPGRLACRTHVGLQSRLSGGARRAVLIATCCGGIVRQSLERYHQRGGLRQQAHCSSQKRDARGR